MNTLRPQIIPLLLLILSLLIFSGCAATEDSTRLSPLEQALTDAITVELNDGTPLASAVSIDTTTDPANPSGTITITGLTNACSSLPCTDAGTLATLTIDQDDPAFTINGITGDFTLAIADAAGAQTTNDTNTAALTINDGTTDITFDIIVEYSGQPVSNIVAAAGANGIADLIPTGSVVVTFASQSASATWNDTGDTLTITGLFNPTGSGTEGSVTLNLASGISLPAGYTLSPSPVSFIDSDGTAEETISSNFSITEDDTTNQASYDLVVVLDTELPDVSISASDLDISVTNTLNSDTIVSSTQLTVEHFGTAFIVTIDSRRRHVRNLDSDTNLGINRY